MAMIYQLQKHLKLRKRYQKRFIKFISLVLVASLTIIGCSSATTTQTSLVVDSSVNQNSLNIIVAS